MQPDEGTVGPGCSPGDGLRDRGNHARGRRDVVVHHLEAAHEAVALNVRVRMQAVDEARADGLVEQFRLHAERPGKAGHVDLVGDGVLAIRTSIGEEAGGEIGIRHQIHANHIGIDLGFGRIVRQARLLVADRRDAVVLQVLATVQQHVCDVAVHVAEDRLVDGDLLSTGDDVMVRLVALGLVEVHGFQDGHALRRGEGGIPVDPAPRIRLA